MHELRLKNERLEGEINVINQQILNSRQNDKNIQEQIDRINRQRETDRKEMENYQGQKDALGDQVSTISGSLDTAKGENSRLDAYIHECQDKIEECKSDIIEYIHESGNLQAKVGRYDAMLENINFRKTQLNQRYLQFKSDDNNDRKEYDELQAKLSVLDQNVSGIIKELETAEKDLEENQNRNKVNRERIHNTNEELSATRSKMEALRNITERYDGYGNSIRRVMEQKKNNPGIIGVVADIIDVDKKYEVAVETALGGSIQNIVTEDDSTAKKIIQFLKQNKYGRATFLPLNTITDRGQV